MIIQKEFKISIMFSFFIIVNTLILLVSIMGIRCLNINIENIEKSYLGFIIISSFFLAIFIDTFIHELGHLIFGKLMGFKLVRFILFPFEISKRNSRYKIAITKDITTIGSCIMVPKKYSNLYKAFNIFFAGGVLFNFVIIIILLIVGITYISVNPNVLIKILYSIFLLVSEFNLINNIIPRKFNGIDNDGFKIKKLLSDPEECNLYLEEFVIFAQLLEGVRPKDIKSEIIGNYDLDIIARIDSELILYLIYVYIDNEDYESISKIIDFTKNNIDKYKEEIQETISYELLYYYSYIVRDIFKARDTYNSIHKNKSDNYNINELRAIITYKAFIEKKYEEALKVLNKAFLLMRFEENNGLIIFEKMKLEEISREIYLM